MGRRKQSPENLAHPRYWTTWLAVALAWPLAQLPWWMLMMSGRAAGRLAWYLARDRRRVAEINVRLCFPELEPEAQRALARESVEGAGQALLEALGTYFKVGLDLSRRLDIRGKHHLDEALGSGKGVLLLGMHFDTIDVGAHLLGIATGGQASAVYRPSDNPVLDRAIGRGRGRHLHAYIDRRDIRAMIRVLRRGGMLWYAPDQDYGVKHSVFAPFFGVPAATITATSRLARMGGALVLPVAQTRQPSGRYALEFGPALKNFPEDDDLVNAHRVNAVIESHVRTHPGQYLWVHRRFKHQPAGKPSPYGRRTPRRSPDGS